MVDRKTFQLPRRAIALVLAGGRGSRLARTDGSPGQSRRSISAASSGSSISRLSNCVNSQFRRIGVVTQYKSHSLLRHLQRGWNFLHGEVNEFVDLLPAQQRWTRSRGIGARPTPSTRTSTSSRPIRPKPRVRRDSGRRPRLQDELRHDAGRPRRERCRMHRRLHRGAAREASGFGVMDVDENGLITDFIEKPADPPAMPGNPDMSCAAWASTSSMPSTCMPNWRVTSPTPRPITTSARTSFHAP
jgi:glucose-1-phosphate adenylyltransferase